MNNGKPPMDNGKLILDKFDTKQWKTVNEQQKTNIRQ